MNLLIVESPAKCKTIEKYLGKDYQVLASFGHIRDLPSKNGSVNPDEDFAMHYDVSADSKKHVKNIVDAVKKSDSLYLATDPDREGEAISWHVLEVLLKRREIKKDFPFYRISFNEITRRAVTEAIQKPRTLDMDLINAQQARRALDYLVGFTLSPVLWRKLPGSRSAGRVQSVALRLVCDRESEIEDFTSQEYWDIKGNFATAKKEQFSAKLTSLDQMKLERFSITNQEQAEKIVADLKDKQYAVSKVEKKQVRRNPYPPFTTSSLQQEASRKLGFGAKRTMMVAQKLYEGINIGGEQAGLITYMRTDGVTVSQEAINGSRSLISSMYGNQYVPDKPRQYNSKAKNAQEAHEAIRPTDVSRTPKEMTAYLDNDQLKLYELIWKRMVASQMQSAVMDQVSADIASQGGNAVFRAVGTTIAFDGFLALYIESTDDAQDKDDDRKLPPLDEGMPVDLSKIIPDQHFTQPPPRYTEASLVKKMEELGIGRPSTYASIISVLQDRSYVRLDKKRFIPEDRGRIVTAFLSNFFKRYVEYDFTANLENELDQISSGDIEWKDVLRKFWSDFIVNIDAVKEKEIGDILVTLED
ncbi:MAG: type I DNA topoisomerase, partial [Rickettsiales bacterium]|nr:type I DNA topoisomerase [Rickettsiales bacterium]